MGMCRNILVKFVLTLERNLKVPKKFKRLLHLTEDNLARIRAIMSTPKMSTPISLTLKMSTPTWSTVPNFYSHSFYCTKISTLI